MHLSATNKTSPINGFSRLRPWQFPPPILPQRPCWLWVPPGAAASCGEKTPVKTCWWFRIRRPISAQVIYVKNIYIYRPWTSTNLQKMVVGLPGIYTVYIYNIYIHTYTYFTNLDVPEIRKSHETPICCVILLWGWDHRVWSSTKNHLMNKEVVAPWKANHHFYCVRVYHIYHHPIGTTVFQHGGWLPGVSFVRQFQHTFPYHHK